MRPPATWYFDADTIGPAKVLSQARSDITWPGDNGERGGNQRNWLPASPIQETATRDRFWIPEVARLGMRIVTRDQRIQNRLLELEAVRTSAGQMFALSSEVDRGSGESLAGNGGVLTDYSGTVRRRRLAHLD